MKYCEIFVEGLFTSIPREYLKKLVECGKLERVYRGVYISPETFEDVMYYMQHKYPKIIYSHETALYFHGLTDRTPMKYLYNELKMKKNGSWSQWLTLE